MHLTGNDIAACVIVGIITLLMLFMSIPLLQGKGAWLIAGFNTMDKNCLLYTSPSPRDA